MCFTCSINLAVPERFFLTRVAQLRKFELGYTYKELEGIWANDPTFPKTNDIEYHIDATPLDDFAELFAKIRPLAHDLGRRKDYSVRDTLAKVNLYRGKREEGILTLSFSPWSQHPPLLDSGYLVLDLAYPSEKNQDFIPFDHPSLGFITDIVEILSPVYGWLESDWTPLPPDTDWLTGRPWYIPSLPVWQESKNPLIVGAPLSRAIKGDFDLGAKSNGLYFCKELGEGRYWITQPGTQAEWEQYRSEMWNRLYKGTEVGERHQAAMRRLREALAKIPASVLNDLNGSGV